MSNERKAPHAIDIEVGSRIRLQRKMKGVSQQSLAGVLGITFQQVQKYEKGTNRVGASRLSHIAQALDVPVSYFFDGSQRTSEEDAHSPETHQSDEVALFLASTEGLNLNRAFVKIASPVVRQNVISLVQALAGTKDEGLAV